MARAIFSSRFGKYFTYFEHQNRKTQRTQGGLLDFAAVTTTISRTPGHDSEVTAKCCKGMLRGGDFTDIQELFLDSAAVASSVRTSPCDNLTICADGCEGLLGGTDLLDVTKLPSDLGAIAAVGSISPGHLEAECGCPITSVFYFGFTCVLLLGVASVFYSGVASVFFLVRKQQSRTTGALVGPHPARCQAR